MVSRRSPSGTHFAELFLAPGPEVIGQTGDNSYAAMFGRNWLLVWDRDTGFLHAFQETSGEWLEVTEELPPVFDAGAPVGSRRWSLAFDQAARVILAYEDADGVVRVTRWDPSVNQYVQNVSFAGVDPCVVIDAAWALDIPQSDVLLFYLSPDRTRVLCRVQRDLYAVEHEIWDCETPVILDRVIATPLRYQVLVSDVTGTPLPEMLLSALYPYLAFDHMAATATGPSAGEYELVVLTYDLDEDIAVTATGPSGGAYADPVINYELTGDTLEAQATGPSGGDYVSVIINYGLSGEGIDAEASGPTGGDYLLAVIETSLSGEGINATATGPTGGSYDPA